MTGGELNHPEVNELKYESSGGYRDIKPEKQMSIHETMDAVGSEMNKAGQEQSSLEARTKEYFDDNGVKYREGDRILPNVECTLGGYKYKTDDLGRTISAEGQLQVKDHEGYAQIKESREVVGRGEMRDTDDRGHLEGDQFNGKGDLINLVPMDSDLNRKGDYHELENELAGAVNAGATVYFKVEPIYEGDSKRPSEFKVTYSIDGDKDIKVFRNGSEAKQ